MARPLAFRIYDEVIKAQAGAPDLTLRELSHKLAADYAAVRATIMRMEKRGVVRRLCRGVYRLPDHADSGHVIAARDEYEACLHDRDPIAAKEARAAMNAAIRGAIR